MRIDNTDTIGTTTTIIVFSILLVAFIAQRIISRLRSTHTIWQHELGLRFRNGRITEKLPPGKHTLWGFGSRVMTFDARRQELVVQGQDLLTADKATIKVSAVLLYRISDAERMFASIGDPSQALHTAVQLALREVVGNENIERFIENKASYGKALASHIAETADAVGVEIHRVEIRDVILGSDLKTVYTGVLRAKMESLAELEKARGSAAALRTMANASRAFDNNPALLQLRYMQTLEQITEGSTGNTIVLGKPEDLAIQTHKT